MIIALILTAAIIAICAYLFATRTTRGRELTGIALSVYIKAHGNIALAWRMIRKMSCGKPGFVGQLGSVSIDTLLMVFLLVIIIYQLIPQVSSENITIQNTSNVSTMAKWAAGLGEWLFPVLGVVAICFMLWSRRGGKKGRGV